MTILHGVIIGAGLASLVGALWLGSEAAQGLAEDMSSHEADWRDIGASTLILGAVGCSVITSLYALTCASF